MKASVLTFFSVSAPEKPKVFAGCNDGMIRGVNLGINVTKLFV